MRPFYPLQKINLVELEQWKKSYDFTGDLGANIMDSVYSELDAMRSDDVAYYAEQFLSHTQNKKITLSAEQRAALFTVFKAGGDERLENFRMLLRDAGSWAWEEAYTPTDLDLDKALKKTLKELPSEQADWFYGREMLWRVYQSLGYEEQRKFIGDILEAASVHIHHKKGRHDRFLIFDPGSTRFIKSVVTQQVLPEPPGVLDWAPPITRLNKDLVSGLSALFDEMKDALISKFFKVLDQDMQNVDHWYRVDYDRQIRTMLDSRYPEAKTAGRELRAFFETSPQLGANPFMTNPRARRLAKDFEEMKALASASPILEFEAQGDPPERYLLRFHGLGLDPKEEVRDTHEIALNLGADYPRSLPAIRWQTPILHPNIAGGTPCLGNIGMNPTVRLVDIVEILWDMTRMAIYNAESQGNWVKLRREYDFPLDPRTIRGEVPRVKDQGDDDVDLIILGRE